MTAVRKHGVPVRETINWDRFELRPLDEGYWEVLEEALGVEEPGPMMKTYLGKSWHLLAPAAGLVDVTDIAESLSRICRYNGHVTAPHYSVAQHAVIVATAVWRATHDPVLALAGLHHDDEEAYLGDHISPLKKLSGMAFVRWLARLHHEAIAERFSLPVEEPLAVSAADEYIQVPEQAYLWTGGKPIAVMEEFGSWNDFAKTSETTDVRCSRAVAEGVVFRALKVDERTSWRWQPRPLARDMFLEMHRQLSELR